VISKGLSSILWSSGCIDVLGYYPGEGKEPVESPVESIDRLIKDFPEHPYALAGIEALEEALEEIKNLCSNASYPLQGSLEKNWLLPSASGAARPTCLAPMTMTGGDLRSHAPILLVGFERFPDFFPRLAAENLAPFDISIETAMVDLPLLRDRRFISARILAEAFDQEDFREEFAGSIRPHLVGRRRQRVGLPAFLGLSDPIMVWQDLEARLGCPVFEIPTLPPSIAGLRLHNLLVSAVQSAGGRFYDGMEASGAEVNGSVLSVYTEAAARRKKHKANTFILATGGLLGGGVDTTFDGQVNETIFNLPVRASKKREEWFEKKFISDKGHPIYRSGLAVNQYFQPLDYEGGICFDNLYAAGACLADFDPIMERSLEGTALATAWRAGKQIVNQNTGKE
jgi:glycerol-3-phosphate dehydrogenase subunit B